MKLIYLIHNKTLIKQKEKAKMQSLFFNYTFVSFSCGD